MPFPEPSKQIAQLLFFPEEFLSSAPSHPLVCYSFTPSPRSREGRTVQSQFRFGGPLALVSARRSPESLPPTPLVCLTPIFILKLRFLFFRFRYCSPLPDPTFRFSLSLHQEVSLLSLPACSRPSILHPFLIPLFDAPEFFSGASVAIPFPSSDPVLPL